ncbi:hypothetical protein ACLOJK_038404 [Asimina triloba]
MLPKLDVEACIHQLSHQGERAQGEASKLSTELGATRVEVVTLRGQVIDPSAKEGHLRELRATPVAKPRGQSPVDHDP